MQCNIEGIPRNLTHLLITLILNIKSTFSIYSEVSAETYLKYYDTEPPNLETCAHVDC